MGDTITQVEGLVDLPTDPSTWEKLVPYKLGDLSIVIEYLAGDTRTKVKGNGAIISNVMPAAYGFILETNDQHGEEIDMYLSQEPHDKATIFVIDQVFPDNKLFDEHKVMLGFESIDQVEATYHKVFGDGSGPTRIGAITRFTIESFGNWLKSEGYSLAPASKFKQPDVSVTVVNGIGVKPMSAPQSPPTDETGGVVINLPDMSRGPKLHVAANEDGGMSYTLYLLSALDTRVWSNTIDTFCRTLDTARENDTVHIRISSPGGSVLLMGRIVSAIKATKAKVITYAQGSVASAATGVWASGHERRILPGAYFMQHMSSQMLGGKTTDIQAKSAFCVDYIVKHLQPLLDMGLFTKEEVDHMVETSSDIFISGREAIARVGKISPAPAA